MLQPIQLRILEEHFFKNFEGVVSATYSYEAHFHDDAISEAPRKKTDKSTVKSICDQYSHYAVKNCAGS